MTSDEMGKQYYQVEELLSLSCNESVDEHPVRRFKDRPAETRIKHHLKNDRTKSIRFTDLFKRWILLQRGGQ